MIDIWLKSSEGQLAILGVLMTVCLHFAGAAWWVDVLSSLRAHLGIAILLGMLLAVSRRHWSVVAVDLLLAGFLLAPLTLSQTPGTAETADLRIALHNVHTANRDFATALANLEEADPDVMAILEVDEGWENAILQHFPDHRVIASPRRDNFGIALVSRIPIRGEGLWGAPPLDAPSIDVILATPRGPVRLLVTHPMPPLSEDWWHARNTQLEAVLARAASSEIPVVIAGDFNLTPTSPSWSRLVGNSLMRRAGLPLGTWPVWLGPVGLPIDHVLTGPGLSVAESSILPGAGSDHRGLLIGLRMTMTISENP